MKQAQSYSNGSAIATILVALMSSEDAISSPRGRLPVNMEPRRALVIILVLHGTLWQCDQLNVTFAYLNTLDNAYYDGAACVLRGRDVQYMHSAHDAAVTTDARLGSRFGLLRII